MGARKLVLHGLGPLGCIPSQRVKSKKGQCLKRVNEWVQEFNHKAKRLTTTLNGRLPNAQFLFADTYPAVLDLIENPTAYGSLLFPFSFNQNYDQKKIHFFTAAFSQTPFLLFILQVLRCRIHPVAMWTHRSVACACPTQKYAVLAGILCFGMHFILQMQQMKC